MFKKVRIDRLFFGSFALFIAVLLLIFTWISYSYTSRELVDNTSNYQQDLLNELNKQLDIQLRFIEQLSLAASRNIDFSPQEVSLYERNRQLRDLERQLANITYSTTMVHSVYFYLDNPIPTGSQGPVDFNDLQTMNEEIWYSDLENNDFTWIPEYTIIANTEPLQVISFARKIYNNSGKYTGVLLLNIKASEIKKLVSGDSENRSRLLLDEGGRTIAYTGMPILREVQIGQIKLSEEKFGSFHLPASNGNEESLLVWSKTPSNWMLVEVTEWSHIVSGSIRLARILLIIGVSAIFVALFFTLFLSRQFTKPIRQLLMIMGKFPSTGAGSDLPNDYKNEFGIMFRGYRRLMEKIEELLDSLKVKHKLQREAEIQALQAMINPHFLYNTLDQLNWLAIERDQHEISEILSLMGNMFRIGLSNGQSMISIPDEITHVQCYLQIQQIRWDERLTYTITVAEGLEGLYIPKLTLQPFVENAIIHGFHNQEKGDIQISVHAVGSDVEIVIQDDGVGLNSIWNVKKTRKTGGYGIRNVKERIAAYYGQGSPYGVEMYSGEERGTTIRIRIPQISNLLEAGEKYNVENSDRR